MKTCNDCKQELPLDKFGKNNAKSDKLNIYCKTCVSIRNSKFYVNNPDYTREYYLTNKIRIQERIETWNEKNPDKCREYRVKYSRKRRELNELM